MVTPGPSRCDPQPPSQTKTSSDRLMMQLLSMTHDLNEREDQIMAFRKREAALAQHLTSKEKLYEKDSVVSAC